MLKGRKEKKEAKHHEEEAAQWQTQRDSYAHLLTLAQTYNGAPTNEIVLKPGEALFYKVTGVGLIEDRAGKGHYSGRSAGVSVPIGKVGGRSVRYRVGASRGHYVAAAPVATAIDSGTMYITNRRVVFKGHKQTRECDFAKLIGYEHSQSGSTTISVSNRQKATTIHYGPNLVGNVDFYLELALANSRGETTTLVAQLTQELSQIDAHRPAGLEAPAIAAAPPASQAAANLTAAVENMRQAQIKNRAAVAGSTAVFKEQFPKMMVSDGQQGREKDLWAKYNAFVAELAPTLASTEFKKVEEAVTEQRAFLQFQTLQRDIVQAELEIAAAAGDAQHITVLSDLFGKLSSVMQKTETMIATMEASRKA